MQLKTMKINSSNQQTIEQWVIQYYDDLYRWAKFKTSDALLAEDLLQEVFLAASQGIDKFNYESNPKTWLFQILNNKIVDHYRKKGKAPFQYTVKEVFETTDRQFDRHEAWNNQSIHNLWKEPGEELEIEMENHLKNCMLSLPDSWKHLVFGKYYEGKNADELCVHHQISKANYWQILHRAKLMLKQCIEKML